MKFLIYINPKLISTTLLYVLLSIAISFPSEILTQDSRFFYQIGNDKFTDGELTGSLHDFKHVFENNPEQLKLYSKFNSSRIIKELLIILRLGWK